jgi:hypothetical protein
MKVLFFYIGTPSPVLEIELELIKKHEKSGDIVHVVQCTGNLPNCHWNAEHNNSRCEVCRSKFKNGWDVLNPDKNVVLKEFPPVNLKRDLELPISFESVKDVSAYRYDNENIGFGAASSVVSLVQDHRFDTNKHRSIVDLSIRTSVEVYDALKKEIEEFCPDRVYLFNGRIATHLPAKLLVKNLGVEFYCYETADQTGHYTLKKNRTCHQSMSSDEVKLLKDNWTDEQQVMGEAIFRFKREGDPSGELVTFEKNHKKDYLPEGFDSNKRNIAIFCGTLDEYEGVEWGTNKLYLPDQTAGVATILETMESNSDFFFYYRIHPNMKNLSRATSQLADIQEISSRFSNVHVIWADEKIDTYALIEKCEKTITFGSGTGVEATYAGKPSILADFSLYDNFDCAYRPETHAELIKLLEDDLEPKSVDAAVKAFYALNYDSKVLFEFYRESDILNSSRVGLFDGVKIQASVFARFRYWLNVFPMRFFRILRQPSLVFRKYKFFGQR